MNNIVKPFLMKFLVKKEICGSREQCMGPTEKANSHRNTGLKKKKKETQMQ